MAEKFDEFLEEIENDIRKEKFLQLWKQYGKKITTGVISCAVIVVAYNFWSYYERNKQAQISDKFVTAQEFVAQGKTDQAITLLNTLSHDSKGSYQHLSLFQKAGLLLQENSESKEAIDLYEKLATNTKIDLLWRNLATLLSVMAKMNQKNFSTEDLLKEIEPIASDQNPWHHYANEIKGILLHNKGESLKALELFARLVQDKQTPSGISMRSRLMVPIVSAEIKD